MKAIALLAAILLYTTMVFAQLTQEQKELILNRHNYYRQLQGAPDLQWSDELQEKAQEWANEIAKLNKLVHSTMNYGENIYWSSVEVTADEPVDAWASEIEYYNGETISYSNYNLFGHYTQIIWAKTQYVGCAYAVSKRGGYYWVCEYDPAGNYIGQKPVEKFKKHK